IVVDIQLGTKWGGIQHFLGTLINQAPKHPAEGTACRVTFHKILLYFWTYTFKKIPQPPKQREVAPDGLLGLYDIQYTHHYEGNNNDEAPQYRLPPNANYSDDGNEPH